MANSDTNKWSLKNISIIVSLAVLLVTVAGSHYTQNAEIAQLKERTSHLDQIREDLAIIKTDVRYIKDDVKEIKGQVK